jgi:hypothetical protein
MRPTQSGKRVFQGLPGARQAARERKQERFTALLHHLSVGLLRDSYYALKRQAAPGVDGVRWQEYETGLEDRDVDLHSRVHRGPKTYRIEPSRILLSVFPSTTAHTASFALLQSEFTLSRPLQAFLLCCFYLDSDGPDKT